MSTAVHVHPDDAVPPAPPSGIYIYAFDVVPTRLRAGTAWLLQELLPLRRLYRELTPEAFEHFRAQTLADGFRLTNIRRSRAVPLDDIE